MNITVDKIKEASYWCKELWVTNYYYHQNEEVVKRFKKSAYKTGQVLVRWIPALIIICIVIFFFAIGRAIYLYPSEPPEPKKVIIYEIIKPVFLSSICIGILYFPIALLLGIKRARKDLEKAVARSNELKQRIESVIKEKIEIISLIPEKYRYPLATSYLTEVIECGRADTMKEALNLYEEQLHRWRMENKMNEVLKKQQNNNSLLWANLIVNSFR
ncbi:hypothetical protein RZO55_02680 [Clostridium boliviensis]|uniref:Uncharacterized protein n=1 Tax=Clostridium boliviensis TaxID=318465 RepID=A0ABU4GFY4_9CLOT|nr:hypothetical protein [Clostridium boliviensis]MDW2796486.1 hypothetical protein [Clostridium boliviensis]